MFDANPRHHCAAFGSVDLLKTDQRLTGHMLCLTKWFQSTRIPPGVCPWQLSLQVCERPVQGALLVDKEVPPLLRVYLW